MTEPHVIDVELVEPSAIDAMQNDVAPRELPADAPGLWPYLRLPFRRRAEFFRAFRALSDRQEDARQLDKKLKRMKNMSQEQQLESMSLMYDVYGCMDDLLRIAAIDKDAYEKWTTTHTDDEFAELFAIYMERSQPGEASSSAN